MLKMKNKMQLYHLDMEGIPEYINAIEDNQKKSKRAGNTIADSTLLLISTNSMLSTEHLPHANKIWEDLRKDKNYWYARKTLYNSDYQKAKVNKKAVVVQDQFGISHGAYKQSPTPAQ